MYVLRFRRQWSSQGFEPVPHKVFCLLVPSQALAGRKLIEVEKEVIITWCRVGTLRMTLKHFPLEFFELSAFSAGSSSWSLALQ